MSLKMHRGMTNLEIAKLLRAISAALSLTAGDNRFRIIAYDRAADAIEHSSTEVKDLWDDHQLDSLAGVGESLASHLDELFKTGTVKHFVKILSPFPPSVFELLDIPGVGPKSAFKLARALKITSAATAVSQLAAAAKKGQIAGIEGFGEDSQAKILLGIQEYQGRSKRLLLPVATQIAEEILQYLHQNPHVSRADPLGSLRRQAATVGDVDISAASDKPQEVIDYFCRYPKKIRVLEAGTHTASLILPNDYQVDLMVQPRDSYGSLLQHFTGSKHHNVALREYALKKGYSLSEYGIKVKGNLKKFSSEEDFYHFLDLDWIPPELREDDGELEAAKTHSLPQLLTVDQIKGDLQIHSNIDIETSHDVGESSIAQLAAAAGELGYDYIGLTEHNPSQSGHTAAQVKKLLADKTRQINEFNSAHENKNEKIPFVFNGLEIDILPSGKLAVPDDCLNLLDYACASLHSSFRQSRAQATLRVLRGLDHPKVRFFAHPTGRLLGQREGVDLDWDQIFDFCLKNHKWVEVNAWPNRLDLPSNLVRQAVKLGVKLVINTDSHSALHLSYMRYGVSVARRGWTKASDVINTLPLTEVRKLT